MLKGLAETEQTLRGRHVPFQLLSGWPTDTLPEFIAEEQPAAVVCDMSPLRVPMAWVNDVAAKLNAAPGPKVPLCRETARRTCAPTSPPIPCPCTSPSTYYQHHEHAHVHQPPSVRSRWWTHQGFWSAFTFPSQTRSTPTTSCRSGSRPRNRRWAPGRCERKSTTSSQPISKSSRRRRAIQAAASNCQRRWTGYALGTRA